MPQDFTWPMYFAKRDLNAPRVKLRKGQAFEMQDKSYIRGLGEAFGVPDAWTRPWHELPYVQVLNVSDDGMLTSIKERGLDFTQAKRLMEGEEV